MKAPQPRFELHEALVDWEANANRGLARAFCVAKVSATRFEAHVAFLLGLAADAITETSAITHALGYKL